MPVRFDSIHIEECSPGELEHAVGRVTLHFGVDGSIQIEATTKAYGMNELSFSEAEKDLGEAVKKIASELAIRTGLVDDAT